MNMANQMTTRQVIDRLIAEGHQIEYYVRSDRGVRITKIDGIRFKGSEGNTYARNLVGVALSERRKAQLTRINPIRRVGKKLTSQIRKIQNKWKKTKAKGKPTTKKIEYTIKTYGIEEAQRQLSEAERYAEGLAYSKNIDALINFCEYYAVLTGEDEFYEIANLINQHRDTIREEWIQPAYQELYTLNNGANPSDVARNVRAILRL